MSAQFTSKKARNGKVALVLIRSADISQGKPERPAFDAQSEQDQARDVGLTEPGAACKRSEEKFAGGSPLAYASGSRRSELAMRDSISSSSATMHSLLCALPYQGSRIRRLSSRARRATRPRTCSSWALSQRCSGVSSDSMGLPASMYSRTCGTPLRSAMRTYLPLPFP